MSNGRGRMGAQQNVQRALGWQGVSGEVSRTEVASCLMCGSELRFSTGEYGQTVERCTSDACPNRRPHPPRPDPSQLKKPYVAKSRRKAKED